MNRTCALNVLPLRCLSITTLMIFENDLLVRLLSWCNSQQTGQDLMARGHFLHNSECNHVNRTCTSWRETITLYDNIITSICWKMTCTNEYCLKKSQLTCKITWQEAIFWINFKYNHVKKTCACWCEAMKLLRWLSVTTLIGCKMTRFWWLVFC